MSYGGTDYEVPRRCSSSSRPGSSSPPSRAAEGNQSLASLGIDPSKWLTNAKNAGKAKVGDTDTIKITGDVDVSKLLDDVNAALQKIRSLGGAQAAQLPSQLTAGEKQQAEDAIKELNVEIYTGADDKILRRFVVTMKLAVPNKASAGPSPPTSSSTSSSRTSTRSQDINAPENTKPFSQLMSKLRASATPGSAPGAAPGQSGGSSGTSQENLQKYSECIQKANGDTSKMRKCADLLTP